MTDDVPVQLARIEGKLDTTNALLTSQAATVADHETRIRVGEPIIATVPGIAADVEALKAGHDSLSRDAISKRALYGALGVMCSVCVAACALLGIWLHH